MTRSLRSSVLITAAVAAALFSTACSGTSTSAAAPKEPAPVAVQATQVQGQSIDRFLRVTGSLAADEKADVAAETAGRVIGTPVERGTRVTAGTVLIRVSATEADASLREAEANAAQLEARLGLVIGQPFDPMKVPDVLNAKAALDWAEADFNRIRALLDQKVVSQSEYRPASDAGPGGPAAVSDGAEHRPAVVPIARGGPRPRRPGAQVRGRHRRPRTVQWHRRRAPRQHWRLRVARNEGGDRSAH